MKNDTDLNKRNTSTSIEQTESQQKPWYKHPWVWFIVALPALAVIASIITVIIAFRTAPEMIPNYDAVSQYKSDKDSEYLTKLS